MIKVVWCAVISVDTLRSDPLEGKEACLDEIRMCREERSVRVEELTGHFGGTRQYAVDDDDDGPFVSKMKGATFQRRHPRTHGQCTHTLGTENKRE